MAHTTLTRPHVSGDDVSDLLALLQTPGFAGLNGTITVDGLRVRVSVGAFILGDFRELVSRLVTGAGASWSWRSTPGAPRGEFAVPFQTALLGAALELED